MKEESPMAQETAVVQSHDYTDRWISEAKTLNMIARQNNCAYALWDAFDNQFVFFSDDHSVLGVNEPDCFIKQEGVKYFLSRVHPSCIKTVYLMYKQCLLHCKTLVEHVQDCLFQFDALYQKNQTENAQLLLQAQVVETDHSGFPLLFLISIRDVTYLKKENTANLVITSTHTATLWNYCFDQKKLEPVRCFSSQEKRVLFYLGQKKGSKEIAAMLNTSSHTIDTQRRSLLHKTNCIDCTALITYSRLTGILS